LLVTVDLGKIDATRTHWPFLRDRRIDAYGDLTKRYVDSNPQARSRAWKR
jgi:N-carbamoylputrescine amidase